MAKKEVTKEVKPQENCGDKKCPFHGNVNAHGRVFTGTVISDKMHGTVNVEWPRQHFVSKFERFERRRSRVKAHNPACLKVKVGDMVKIAECRPLSKTVHFVVLEKVK